MARRRPPVRSRRQSRDLLLEALESRRLLAGIVAVGNDTGASSTPLVRLVDTDGIQQASVMAFEPTFRGGVRLAMGHVTGHAAADLVVGSGSGRAAEVKVFRPVTAGGTTTLRQVLAFNPFGAGYRGGIEVAVGNVDGIGSEDIVVSKSREGGEVRVFRMTNGGATATLYATIANPFGASYNGGTSVGVADVGEFKNGAFVKSVGDNQTEVLVGSGAGITAQVLVYDVSRPASPRVADTILPAFNAAYGQPFTGGVSVSSGRYDASGVADSIDEIAISAGRGGSGAAQTLVYDGTVSAAANALRRGFTTYGAAERPNAAVFTAPVDADGNGQVDRFFVTQGDPGGPAGIASVSVAGVRATSPVTSLAGPLRIATPRTVFQPQTINGTVATPSPTAGVAAGASRPMQIREIVTGAGTVPATWDRLTVQYTGMLTDGTVFDSSRQTGRSAFQFTLGAGQVISGWEAGFVGMKVGGRRLLTIPPELGYGDAGGGSGSPIKGGDTLVFDVELVAVTANKIATITGSATGAVTAGSATTSTGGTLTVTDPDDTPGTLARFRQSVFRTPTSLAGTYGTFAFNAASGAWSYTVDNTRPATQALTSGQSVTDSLAVTSRDGTASRTIVVTVAGGNEVASISGTSTGSLTEDNATTSVGGTLTVTDADAGQAGFATPGSLNKTYGSFTFDAATGVWAYTLDNSRPATQALKAGQTVTDSLVVTSLDGSANRTITVTITGAADAPTGIALSAATVAENSDAGTVIGTFSTTDVDAGDTFTYTFVSGTGDTNNGSFAIAGATLKTKDPLDFETKSSYTIRVRSTDGAGLFVDKQFTITITNVNETPTGIALSATTVAENAAANTAVGTFSTTDADAGDTFTYALVNGTGDSNNEAFWIDGATLKIQAPFNFESPQTSYSIRVRSTDAGGRFTDQPFTITVTNVNEGPTGISLSAASVAENSEVGTEVGTFSMTDADVGDTFTYEFISGTGDADNGSFTIDGATLKTKDPLDFETKKSYSILVRSTDAGGLSIDKQFTITVTNVNEAASISGTSTGALTEDDATTTVDGTLVVSDVDDGQAVFQTPASLAGTYGTFAFNPTTGVWSYTLDNSRPVTQALTPGQEVTDSLVVKSLDGTASETITVTITGVAISGTSKGSIDAESTTTTTGGTLVVSVPDAAEPYFAAPDSLDAVYGTFTFDTTTGDWTYTFDPSRYWAWVLTSDRPVTDSLTVASADGTASKTIEVTITGYTMQTMSATVTRTDADVAQGTVSSLQYRDLSVGSGDTAEPGMLVAVHYIGYLDDATMFDSSLLPGRSYFVFQLDAGEVIAGWDAGVAGMKVGGVRVLVIPPELAYGNSGQGDIPPGARLSFIVQLLAVQAPTP